MEGQLPSWLHGSLVRNGPGTFRGMKHLFDGYAMLVKVSFKDGRASVQQRQASLPFYQPRSTCLLWWYVAYCSVPQP